MDSHVHTIKITKEAVEDLCELINTAKTNGIVDATAAIVDNKLVIDVDYNVPVQGVVRSSISINLQNQGN